MYNQSVVRRVMKGDEVAFRILFEDWAEVVYGRAYDILHDGTMAHEVVKRTFVDVYRLTPRLRDGRQFDEWLRRLVAYQCGEVALQYRTLNEQARERDWMAIAQALDIPPEEETILEIKQIVEKALEEQDYSEIQHEIVRTGRKLWISSYITLEKNEVSLLKFQIAQSRCIEALSQTYSDFYFELLPHIEFSKDLTPTNIS